MNVATSEGVKPWVNRAVQIVCRLSRTRENSGAEIWRPSELFSASCRAVEEFSRFLADLPLLQTV